MVNAAHAEALAEQAERETAGSRSLRVTFERLGRSHDVEVEIDRAYLDDVDEFARQIHAFARKRVASRHFEVEVDVERGVVLIEGGRFGRGTFAVPAPSAAEVTPPEQHATRDGYLAQFPAPRAERLGAAFRIFNGLADSGGPGTAKGVIGAVEAASTLTDAEAEAVAADLIERLNGLGLSTPLRVSTSALVICLRHALAEVGLRVKL